MAQTTVTQALAELKTLDKRLETKRQFVATYLVRATVMVDPLEKDGGSVTAIKRELQSIHDLEERKVAIRRAIANANAEHTIMVGGTARSINDWLVWRREVAPMAQRFLAMLRDGVKKNRDDAVRRGYAVTDDKAAAKPGDVVVNISERDLHDQIEAMEETLGTLDGLLSLKNATITIEV